MRITKSIIKNLSWPTGATHLRVDCEGGKHAIADRKGAAVSFDGIEGDLTFGAVVKEGKAQKFMPLANGKVDMATLAKPTPVAPAVKPANPTAKEGGEPVAEQVQATEPAEAKAKPAKAPKAPKEKKVREPKTDGPVAFIRSEYIAGKLTARQVAEAMIEKFGGELAKRLVMVRSITYSFKQAGVVGGFRRMTKEERGASRGTATNSKAAKLSTAAELAALWAKAGGKLSAEVVASLDRLVIAYS